MSRKKQDFLRPRAHETLKSSCDGADNLRMAAQIEPQAGGPTMRPRPGRLLGDVVVELGLCDRDTVEQVVRAARASGRPMGQLLLEQQHLRPHELGLAIAGRFGLDFVDLSAVEPDITALDAMPAAMMHRLDAVPIAFRDDGTLLVAMVDPGNLLVTDDIAMLTNRSVVPVVVTRADLDVLLARADRPQEVVDDDVDEREGDATAPGGVLEPVAEDGSPVELVHSLMAGAIEQRASAVHFDPDGDDLLVRYRVDGVMRDVTRFPAGEAARVISAIKIVSQLDLSERHAWQDGRLTLTRDGRRIDVRVVTVPLVAAESAVLHVLDLSDAPLELGELGMDDADRVRLETALHRARGAIIATGPRGTGKSTTLRASIGAVNTPEKTIMTIEDPVEHTLARVKQIQISDRAGATFASAIRCAMSADPDIIMVSELRDSDSATLAIEAALSGHLILSSLHSRSAAAAVHRLIDMGITPHLVATSLECVVGQRLVRRLCTHCRCAVAVPAEAVGLEREAGDIMVYEARGCGRCGETGYRGRAGIYEVMTVTVEIRSLIAAGATAAEIERTAVDQGMRPLRAAGDARVRSGETSLAEVARVTT